MMRIDSHQEFLILTINVASGLIVLVMGKVTSYYWFKCNKKLKHKIGKHMPNFGAKWKFAAYLKTLPMTI